MKNNLLNPQLEIQIIIKGLFDKDKDIRKSKNPTIVQPFMNRKELDSNMLHSNHKSKFKVGVPYVDCA